LTELTATVLAGETYVDVPHGLSTVPTADDISITPKDDLGGRSWFIDPIDATNFRLNISSLDLADHVFGYHLFVSDSYAPAADRYGILNTVKNLLLIDLSETTYDTQIDVIIKAADNIINNALERCGETVPLTSPDDIIHDISNYLAAGLYKQKDVPDEKVHSFYTVGMNMLNSYIANHYPGEGVEPSGEPELPLAYGVGLAV
jgi:hypothetical protein